MIHLLCLAVYVKIVTYFFVFDFRRREAFLEQFSGELCAKISEEVLTESIHETAKSEIRFALEEKAAFIARCSEEETNRIVEETLNEEVAAVAKEILDCELRRVRKFIKRFVELCVLNECIMSLSAKYMWI